MFRAARLAPRGSEGMFIVKAGADRCGGHVAGSEAGCSTLYLAAGGGHSRPGEISPLPFLDEMPEFCGII
jgi:hypothetical protein